MLTPVSKLGDLNTAAHALVSSLELIDYKHQIYCPVHWQTMVISPTPPPMGERVWLPLTPADLVTMANTIQGIGLLSQQTENSYIRAVMQNADAVSYQAVPGVLVVKDGKKLLLKDDGTLVEPGNEFVPNYVKVPISTDQEAKDEMLAILVEWLGGEREDAESLLAHLATMFAPNWSVARYLLLIGDGRNGKSVLLQMLMKLLGRENVSSVTRQTMAAGGSACLNLQSKLANIVMDGPAEFVKESGPEKSFTAGEPVSVRPLFQSLEVPVQTFGLFIEALNREPKTSDKSSALQKRIVRFHFPNTYQLDVRFHDRMMQDRMLGALFALILDHWVSKDEVAAKLKATATSEDLEMEQTLSNSRAHQWLRDYLESSMFVTTNLIGVAETDLVQLFQRWRLHNNDISYWSDEDVRRLLRPLFVWDRMSVRTGTTVKKVRFITGLTENTERFLGYVQGEEDPDAATMVADGGVPDRGAVPAGPE